MNHVLKHCRLFKLPAELLLNVLDKIDVLDLPNFVYAEYPLLQYHGIAPPQPLSHERMTMRRATMAAAAESPIASSASSTSSRASTTTVLGSLPPELRAVISGYLNTSDRIQLAVATWPMSSWLKSSPG